MTENRRSEYVVRTEAMRAEGILLEQTSKKAPVKGRTTLRARFSFASSMSLMPSWVQKQLRARALSRKENSMQKPGAGECS